MLPVISRVEIHQLEHPLRVATGERGELDAGERVPDKVGARDPQRVEERADVRDQAIRLVARLRLVRPAVPAAGQGEHAEAVDEPRRELGVDLGRPVQPWQQKDRLPAAAPVQVVESDAGVTVTKPLRRFASVGARGNAGGTADVAQPA